LKYLSIVIFFDKMWAALKRASYVVAFGGCVSQLFFNSLLTSRSVQFFLEICLSSSLLCTASDTNFLSKSCPCRWIPR